jgi:MYXO-CTERM domain-containing protein
LAERPGDGSTLNSGVEATVVALEVPAGVTVDSATNSEGAYNVPEPVSVAAAVAVGALAALRRRGRA